MKNVVVESRHREKLLDFGSSRAWVLVNVDTRGNTREIFGMQNRTRFFLLSSCYHCLAPIDHLLHEGWLRGRHSPMLTHAVTGKLGQWCGTNDFFLGLFRGCGSFYVVRKSKSSFYRAPCSSSLLCALHLYQSHDYWRSSFHPSFICSSSWTSPNHCFIFGSPLYVPTCQVVLSGWFGSGWGLQRNLIQDKTYLSVPCRSEYRDEERWSHDACSSSLYFLTSLMHIAESSDRKSVV